MENLKFNDIREFYYFIDSLDIYNRILIGQYENIGFAIDTKFKYNLNVRNKIDELFLIRKYFIPQLNSDKSLSMGIWTSHTPMKAIKSFDIQQTLRYEMAYHVKPEGGLGIIYHSPLIKGCWEQELFKNNNGKYKDCVPAKFISFEPIEIQFIDNCKEILNEVKLVNKCLNNLEFLKLFEVLYGKIEDETIVSKIKEIEDYIYKIHKNRLENN